MRDNLDWVEGLLEDKNPWVIVSKVEDRCDPGDAFIGNGLIGQRIGATGDASDFNRGSACLMHGFWSDRALLELPSWAILKLHESDYGQSLKSRLSFGTKKNYEQRLFLKEGRVETKYLYESNKLNANVKSTSFISKTRQNLGALKLEIESHKNNALHAVELTLDAFYCAEGKNWGTTNLDNVQSLSGLMGRNDSAISITSQYEIIGASPVKEEVFQDNKKITKILYFKLNAGQKVTVIKWCSIRSRGDKNALLEDNQKELSGVIGNYEGILAEHTKAWGEYWESRIEVKNLNLQTLINASLYYFGSNLREGVNWSLGPVGLSGRHWGVRIFWDADLWMHPVVALLHPELGSCFSEYRINTLEGALRNAKAEGRKGACISWEAAEFGDEKCPVSAGHEQRHVNADVLFMLQMQYLITGDSFWLKEKALPLIRAIADYWESRVTWSQAKNSYEINGVYCADEYAGIQNNNASTNFCASWSLKFAYHVCKKWGEAPSEKWMEIADNLFMPWNEERQIWDEYEGWTGQEKIKQADTTLMIYPYEKEMDDALKSRLNDYYKSCYESLKIMMGSAIDGIIDCELSKPESGWQSLLDMALHFRLPFLCVSERPNNETINFLTGLGGFLQLVVMGFGGIRLHEGELLAEKSLPENCPQLRIYGMHYLGNRFDLVLDNEKDEIEVHMIEKKNPFVIKNRKGNVLYKSN